MSLTVGSLFTGIGGLDLGLEAAGMRVLWQCESDAYCREVLAKRWPGVPCYPDARSLPYDVPAVDLVCGGFPCQPVSLAGPQLGTADERWLWPDFARALRLLRPRYALLENVPGLTVRGMGDVLGALAALGYSAEWGCVPAAAVGAPHLRWRIFILADASGARRWENPRGAHGDESAHAGHTAPEADVANGDGERRAAGPLADAEIDIQRPRLCEGDAARVGGRRPGGCGSAHALADAASCGCVGGTSRRDARGDEAVGQQARGDAGHGGETLADACGLQDGRLDDGAAATIGASASEDARRGHTVYDHPGWESESGLGRMAYGIPHRMDRLKALGNAVVPQVAELVGRRLLAQIEAAA